MKVYYTIDEKEITVGRFKILVTTEIDEQMNIYEHKAVVGYNEKDGETEIVIPNYIKKIVSYAFLNCNNLTSIILPDSVEEIDKAAFKGCINLTNITLPNKLELIGSQAFLECESLKSITLPNSVREMGYYIFDKRYIKEINLPSYQVFSVLNNDKNEALLGVAISSTIKNYYTGKIKYSDYDMKLFKEYIRENKSEVFEYLENNKEIIHIILNDMGNFLRKEDIDELLNKFDTEINGMLLEYINKNYNTKPKNIKSIIDNKFDLDKDEEKNKEKKLKKGE